MIIIPVFPWARSFTLLLIAHFVLFANMAAAAPSVEEFLAPPSILDVDISPSGRYLAQVWDKEGLRIVSVQDLSKPDKPIVGKLGDRVTKAYRVAWANDERLLVTATTPMKTGHVKRLLEKDPEFDIREYPTFTRIFAMNPDATGVVTLMDRDPYAKNNRRISQITHYLPQDPKHVLIPHWRGSRYSLSKVNVYTGDDEVVIHGNRFTRGFLADADGKVRYRTDYYPVAKRLEILRLKGNLEDENWYVIDTIDFDEIRENEEFDEASLVGLLGDNLIYRKKNEETGYYELIEFDPKKEKMEVLVSLADRSVRGQITDAATLQIVGYTVIDRVKRYFLFDEDRQKEYDTLAAKLGGTNFSNTSFTRDSSKSVVFTYGPDNPGTYYLYDWGEETLRLINYADFSLQDQLSVPLYIVYPARDGTPIPAHVLIPRSYEDGKRLPMVLLPHGGPASYDWAYYDNLAQFLSTRGYIVMKPNFRGSSGYGKAFEEAGYKQWGLAMQDDLTDAVAYMVAEGLADPEKVCIVGTSYGGYAALIGAMKTPDVYACSVSMNGVTDLLDMVEYDVDQFDDDRLSQKYVYSRIGHPERDAKLLAENSPINLVQNVRSPILLIAGERDKIVPADQSQDLANSLKKHKKKYRYIELEDTAHNPFGHWRDRETAYRALEKFLSENLE